MTATQLLFLRDAQDNETIGSTYVSYHPPSAKYVATLLLNGEARHDFIDRWDDAEHLERRAKDAGYSIVARAELRRTSLRAARWNGIPHLVHGDEAMLITQDEVTAGAGTNKDDLLLFLASIATKKPACSPLLHRWMEDKTILLNSLVLDLRHLSLNPNEDTEDQDSQSSPPGQNIVEAWELDFKPPPRCPECDVGITASGRGEPFAVIAPMRPLCRQHGKLANDNYPQILAEYWAWRAQRAQALKVVEK